MEGTLLIVEPQEARSIQYEHLARNQGLVPIVVRTGDAALAALRRSPPPVVIVTELSLPGVDGFAVLREAHKLKPHPKVLVISAFREMRDVAAQQRLELGIDGLLATTSPLASIDRALRRLLSPEPVAPHPSPTPGSRPPVPGSRPSALILTPESKAPPQRPAAPAGQVLEPGQPSEEHLRDLSQELARTFGVPCALIGFTLGERQMLKLHVATPGRAAQELTAARVWNLCKPVLEAKTLLAMNDAAQSPALAENPLVKDGLVRGFAGVPLSASLGGVVGAICILDHKPLSFGGPALDLLQVMARWIGTDVGLREDIARRALENDNLRAAGGDIHRAAAEARAFLGGVIAASSEGIALFDGQRRLIAINEALTQITGIPRATALTMDMQAWAKAVGALVRDPQRFGWVVNGLPTGPFALREEIEIMRPTPRSVRWTARPIRLQNGEIGFVFAYAEVVTVAEVGEDADAMEVMSLD